MVSLKRYKGFKLAYSIICALLLLARFIGGGEASAATYYVSPNGSDSNNGSTGAPFRTIQKAANIVSPGDTVIVKNGTYTGGANFVISLTRGGTVGNYVTFKSETKWGAVIDGQSNTTNWCWNFFTGANYIRVEDFEIKGCNYAGFLSNETSNEVYIYGNNVHNIHTGIVDPYEVSGSTGKSGAYLGRGATNYTFDSNVFHSLGRTPNSPPIEQDYGHDHGIYTRGNNTTIINNIFYDLQAGFGIQLAPVSSGHKVVNNTFVGPNPGKGGGGIMLWQADTVLIQNNIFSSYGSYAISCGRYNSAGVLVYNNLTSQNVTLLQSRCAGKDITTANNKEGRDPMFSNLAGRDFHLRTGSPAIDGGLSKGSPAHDHDKNSRPQGNGYDIGAYEFTAR